MTDLYEEEFFVQYQMALTGTLLPENWEYPTGRQDIIIPMNS
jgi:hypothetical protein